MACDEGRGGTGPREGEVARQRSPWRLWLERTFGSNAVEPQRRGVWDYVRAAFFTAYIFLGAIATALCESTAFLLCRWTLGPSKAQIAVNFFMELYFFSLAWLALRYAKIENRFAGERLPMRESALVVGNHQWMLDWGVMTQLSCRKGMSGAIKFFAKHFVLFIPGIGLGLWMGGGVFLKRNWAKDKASIDRTFDRLRTLKGVPIWLTTWPEGTRYCPEKLVDSQVFCREQGLPVYEHVLCPRSKGVVAAIRGVRDLVPAFYDITVGYENAPPTILDLAFGNYGHAIHFYCRRFPMSELPEDEEDLRQWIFKLFKEKDDLMKHFKEHGKFPGPEIDEPIRFERTHPIFSSHKKSN